VGTVPAGQGKGADAAGGPQTFRSPTAVILWWVWLLFAAANLVDLAVQGRDYASLVAAAILLLVTGGAYVAAQRPRIIADDAGITIRNPLRDHHIGWAGVTRIDLTDMLRVHCAPSYPGQQGKVISSWAVHYSRRRKLVAETSLYRAAARAGSRRRSLGLPYDGSRGPGPTSPVDAPSEAEAERIVGLLTERATAARAEAVWAAGTVPIAGAGREAGQIAGAAQIAGTAAPVEAAAQTEVDLGSTGWLEPLASTWSWPAIAALVIPALILLVISLI
jgi:PH (Pleckstrin Homology) domain-containing protein